MQAAFFVIRVGNREGLDALNNLLKKYPDAKVIPTGFQARYTEEFQAVEHGVMVLYEEIEK